MKGPEAFFFLCRCISASDGSGAVKQQLAHAISHQRVDWKQVIRIADKHFVLPLLYWNLKKRDLLRLLPADMIDILSTIYVLSRHRNRRLKDKVVEIARQLNSVSVEPVLLKGMAALFHETYEDAGLRTMVDIDLLVPRERMADCVSALRKVGFEARGDTDESHYDHHQHYAPLFHKDSPALLELHREAVGFRYQSILPAQEIFNRSVTIRAGDAVIRLPDPSHFLLNNIIHGQFSDGGYRYGWVKLYQIYDMVAAQRVFKQGIDWSMISRRFKRAGYQRVLDHYITLSEQLFNQPGPSGIPRTRFSVITWWLFQAQIKHRWVRTLYMLCWYTHIRLLKLGHNPAYRLFLVKELLDADRRRHQMAKLKALIKTVIS